MGGRVIFTCTATGILKADALYLKATGQNADLQPHVDCKIDPYSLNLPFASLTNCEGNP